jgi:phage shock protein C
MMATSKLYRSRHGKLLGVCRGIADWKDFPVGVIRLLAVLLACCTAIAPCVIIYVLLAIFLPVEPDSERYDYDDLKDRVDRMEKENRKHEREREWDQRFSDNT